MKYEKILGNSSTIEIINRITFVAAFQVGLLPACASLIVSAFPTSTSSQS